MGGKAGAINVAWDIRCSTGEPSDKSERSPMSVFDTSGSTSSEASCSVEGEPSFERLGGSSCPIDFVPLSLSASESAQPSTLRGTSAWRDAEFGRDLLAVGRFELDSKECDSPGRLSEYLRKGATPDNVFGEKGLFGERSSRVDGAGEALLETLLISVLTTGRIGVFSLSGVPETDRETDWSRDGLLSELMGEDRDDLKTVEELACDIGREEGEPSRNSCRRGERVCGESRPFGVCERPARVFAAKGEDGELLPDNGIIVVSKLKLAPGFIECRLADREVGTLRPSVLVVDTGEPVRLIGDPDCLNMVLNGRVPSS
jgi:hypothetical protein